MTIIKRDERIQVGPGEARLAGSDVTENFFEYEEAGHLAKGHWDPREDDVYFYLGTLAWYSPAGEPTSEDARERIREGMWQISRQFGVKGLLDIVMPDAAWVFVRWSRPSGYLFDGETSKLRYMELGRTLVLPHENALEGEAEVSIIRKPTPLSWTYPNVPMDPEHWRVIVQRIQGIGPGDLWQRRYRIEEDP